MCYILVIARGCFGFGGDFLVVFASSLAFLLSFAAVFDWWLVGPPRCWLGGEWPARASPCFRRLATFVD